MRLELHSSSSSLVLLLLLPLLLLLLLPLFITALPAIPDSAHVGVEGCMLAPNALTGRLPTNHPSSLMNRSRIGAIAPLNESTSAFAAWESGTGWGYPHPNVPLCCAGVCANVSRLNIQFSTVECGNMPARWLTSAEMALSQVDQDDMRVLPRLSKVCVGPRFVFAEGGMRWRR